MLTGEFKQIEGEALPELSVIDCDNMVRIPEALVRLQVPEVVIV